MKHFKISFLPLLFAFIFSACDISTEAQLNAAKKLLDEKKYEEALPLLDKVLLLDKKNADAYNMRAVARVETGNVTAAIEDFDAAFHLNETDYRPLYNRGNANMRIHEYELAYEDFTKSLKVNPSEPDIYLSRGMCLAHLSRQKEAIADFTQGLNLSPDNIYLLFNRGAVQAQLKNYDAALHDMHRCVEISGNNGKVHYYLAIYHFQIEKKVSDEICTHLQAAIDNGYTEAAVMQKELCQSDSTKNINSSTK